MDIGFSEAWKSVQEGNAHYKEGKGTYDMARDLFLFANQYNPENAELNYLIGVCYLFTDDKYNAIDYLLKAYQLKEDVSRDINFLLGQAYHLVLEFDNAARHYKQHKELLSEKEQLAYAGILSKRLAECQYGRELASEPRRVILQNLGEGVNSRYDEYNPVFSYGDTVLYFTSRRPFEKSKRNPLDNKFNEDIYRSAPDGRDYTEAARLPKPFNSAANDGIVGVNASGDRYILYRGDKDGGNILFSDYHPEKRKWSKPKPMKSKLLSKEGETSATTSSDGSELFFVSSNARLTTGGKDILYSKKDEKGRWEDPVNLSRNINTPYDEEGVFLSPDGNNLYFASQGHNSMGGFDIFRSRRGDDGKWSDPVNLGYPVNTPDDELFYITDRSGRTGYYSTIREGGYGARDLYKVIYLGAEKELITAMKDQLVAGPPEPGTGFYTWPELPDVDTTVLVTGFVLDTVGGRQGLFAGLDFMDPTGEYPPVNAVTDDSGRYVAHLPVAGIFGVEVNATGYLYFLDILDLLGEDVNQKHRRDFYLQKVEVGTKVVLENIYFETGKAVLRPESFEALDQVLRFVENNPDMKLEISGHTDNTGSLRINQKLSAARAKAVVDYLVSSGIPQEQLVSQGYADSQPVAANDTPEGREQNRRVEFKVLSK